MSELSNIKNLIYNCVHKTVTTSTDNPDIMLMKIPASDEDPVSVSMRIYAANGKCFEYENIYLANDGKTVTLYGLSGDAGTCNLVTYDGSLYLDNSTSGTNGTNEIYTTILSGVPTLYMTECAAVTGTSVSPVTTRTSTGLEATSVTSTGAITGTSFISNNFTTSVSDDTLTVEHTDSDGISTDVLTLDSDGTLLVKEIGSINTDAEASISVATLTASTSIEIKNKADSESQSSTKASISSTGAITGISLDVGTISADEITVNDVSVATSDQIGTNVGDKSIPVYVDESGVLAATTLVVSRDTFSKVGNTSSPVYVNASGVVEEISSLNLSGEITTTGTVSVGSASSTSGQLKATSSSDNTTLLSINNASSTTASITAGGVITGTSLRSYSENGSTYIEGSGITITYDTEDIVTAPPYHVLQVMNLMGGSTPYEPIHISTEGEITTSSEDSDSKLLSVNTHTHADNTATYTENASITAGGAITGTSLDVDTISADEITVNGVSVATSNQIGTSVGDISKPVYVNASGVVTETTQVVSRSSSTAATGTLSKPVYVDESGVVEEISSLDLGSGTISTSGAITGGTITVSGDTVVTLDATQAISGEKSFDFLKAKFSINSDDSYYRYPLTVPQNTTNTSKNYLLGATGANNLSTNMNASCYMENGVLYSGGEQVLTPVTEVATDYSLGSETKTLTEKQLMDYYVMGSNLKQTKLYKYTCNWNITVLTTSGSTTKKSHSFSLEGELFAESTAPLTETADIVALFNDANFYDVFQKYTNLSSGYNSSIIAEEADYASISASTPSTYSTTRLRIGLYPSSGYKIIAGVTGSTIQHYLPQIANDITCSEAYSTLVNSTLYSTYTIERYYCYQAQQVATNIFGD